MGDTAVTLQRADDLAYVESVLERNDLPSADVRAKPDCFYVGHTGEARVGVGGIERYGTAGLPRSLVVERSMRRDGVGPALCAALEAEARSDGVETLFLLTTTRRSSSRTAATPKSSEPTRPAPSSGQLSSRTCARRRRRVCGSLCSIRVTRRSLTRTRSSGWYCAGSVPTH